MNAPTGRLRRLAWILASLARPLRSLAHLGTCRAVNRCQTAVERARRTFGPGSPEEDQALDRLEEAMERNRQARSRLLGRPGPGH